MYRPGPGPDNWGIPPTRTMADHEASNPGLSSRAGIVGWWLNVTAPPKPSVILPVAARERLRKAELTSYSILAVFVFLIALLSNSLADPSTAQAVAFMAVGLAVASVLNRTGRTVIAATLVPILLMAVVALGVLGAVQLDIILFPAFDLFVLPIFLSSLILNRYAPWIFAVIAIAFIAAAFFVEPHALTTATTPPNGSATNFDVIAYYTGIFGWWGMLNRHVGLLLTVAFFAWLGARSQETAILRADRAEEIAELERREVERTRELEEGVHQLLEVHVRLANGDFSVRAQNIRNPLLWQIGNSLNNLINRLSRFAQADFVLRRTQDESRRVTEAIHAYLAGRQPIWPVPAQTPLDPIIEALRRGTGGAPGGAGQGAPPRSMQPSSWSSPAQLPPSGSAQWSQANPPSNMPSQPASSGALPDWLRPLMPEGAPSLEPQQPPNPLPRYPQQQSGAGSAGEAQNNPWNLDPEANLPEWLRQTPDDGGEY